MVSVKRLMAFILSGIISISFAFGQVEKQDDEATEFRNVPLTNARIEFENTEFDFGSIVKGSSVTHSFWFTNAGPDTLVITKIKPTCGCTVAKQGGIIVAPGGKASIDIVFNSGNFNGKVTKSINIETNDKLNPYAELRFKSTINNPLLRLSYSPLQADFKNVAFGQDKTFTIDITNSDSTVSELIIVEKPADDFIKAKLAKQSLKPQESTTLQLTLAKNLAAGPYLSAITLEVKDKYNSRITIPISVTVDEGKSSN